MDKNHQSPTQRVDRLFLYNTCLVICGITMAFSNYFQASPLFSLLTINWCCPCWSWSFFITLMEFNDYFWVAPWLFWAFSWLIMIFVDAEYEDCHNFKSTQPATAAIFGHNCADLASLNELTNATIASGSLSKFWLSRSIIRWRRQSYKTLKLGKWKWYIFFFRRFECKQHVFHNLRSCKCNSCLRWVYQMRQIRFEIHISSKQYLSDLLLVLISWKTSFLQAAVPLCLSVMSLSVFPGLVTPILVNK